LCAGGRIFFEVVKNCQVLCQTVGDLFLVFLPKTKDSEPIDLSVEVKFTSNFEKNTSIIYRTLNSQYFKSESEREWVVGDKRVERMTHFYTKYYNSFADARRKHL
jgi:hypothetical protein